MGGRLLLFGKLFFASSQFFSVKLEVLVRIYKVTLLVFPWSSKYQFCKLIHQDFNLNISRVLLDSIQSILHVAETSCQQEKKY